jgi:16S rRNA processing protein RimM
MNKLAMENLVHVGFILKPHGYQGLIKVSLLREEAEEIQTEWVMLMINNKPVPFFVVQNTPGHNEWLIQLEDINSDDDVKEIQGVQVYIPSSLLPEVESNTTASLIGYQVIDNQEGNIGVILDDYESAKQHFISLEHKGLEVIIPNVTEIIYHIDFDKKLVFSKIPEGLLDINP